MLISNVPLVAPEMLPPLLRFEKEPPPLVLTCHCTVGAGVPLAAAVNVTLASPYVLVTLLGLVVTEGAVQVYRFQCEQNCGPRPIPAPRGALLPIQRPS